LPVPPVLFIGNKWKPMRASVQGQTAGEASGYIDTKKEA